MITRSGGLVIAVQGTGALLGLLPAGLELPRMEEVRLEGTVLAFTGLLTLLSGLVFGLVPVLGTRSAELTRGLREGRGESGSARRRLLRNGLVVTEIALALVLGAGLLLRSFTELRRIDTGLEPRRAAAAASARRGVLGPGARAGDRLSRSPPPFPVNISVFSERAPGFLGFLGTRFAFFGRAPVHERLRHGYTRERELRKPIPLW